MAAFKEGTVIVLDISSHMKGSGVGSQSALQISIQCVTQMLQNKLFTESKDEFALVLVGSEQTENRLNELTEDQYESIKTDGAFRLVDWEMLETLSAIQEPSSVQGDVFEALKVALDIIEKDTENAGKKKRFANRRIVLFSNLEGPMSAFPDQVDKFAANMENEGVNMLQLIGVDLGQLAPMHPAQATKGSHKQKKHGSPAEFMNALFDKLISNKVLVDKETYSFQDAVEYTNFFATRQVRPTPWKGILQFGDSLSVAVVGYSKTKIATTKQNWKKAYAQDPSVGIVQSTQFFVQKGLQRDEVPATEIIDAFRYGTTLVPFSTEDKQSMKYKNTAKCLKVLGCAPASQVKAHLYVGSDVKIFTAVHEDDAALTAMSALVQALKQEDMVIIAKFGYNSASVPKMVSLSPHICGSGLEDDVRFFTFAALKDSERKAQLQPDEEQLKAVEKLVDELTLTEDDPTWNIVSPKSIRNPALQKLYQSLQKRALDEKAPLPEIDQTLVASLLMPKELVKASKETREQVQALFPLKKVEHVHQFKKGFKDIENGDMDVVAAGDAVIIPPQITNLKQDVATAIGTVSPVEDFVAMAGEAADNQQFSDVVGKAVDIVNQLIFKTFDGAMYSEKVLNLVRAVREECVKRGLPELFNHFLTSFKESLMTKKQTTVWNKLVGLKLSLISKTEVNSSSTTPKQSEEFLRTVVALPKEADVKPIAPDENDMFSEMFS